MVCAFCNNKTEKTEIGKNCNLTYFYIILGKGMI